MHNLTWNLNEDWIDYWTGLLSVIFFTSLPCHENSMVSRFQYHDFFKTFTMLLFKKGWGKPMQKKANKQSRGGRGYAKQSKGTQGASDGTPHSTIIRLFCPFLMQSAIQLAYFAARCVTVRAITTRTVIRFYKEETHRSRHPDTPTQ